MRKLFLILGVMAVAALLGARAVANRRHHGHGMFHAAMKAHVEAALDAAKATPAQRQAIAAARDHVLAVVKGGASGGGAEVDTALALFSADRLDKGALDKHRARHQAEAKRIGDALVQAAFDAHAALTPDQRRAIVEYVRAHKPAEGGVPHKRAFMKRLVQNRLDDALDEIKATDKQRATVMAAKDRVIAAIEQTHQGRGAEIDRLFDLFAADRIDGAQLEAMLAEHQANLGKLADALVGAIGDVHATLDAGQRKAVVDLVRARHKKRPG